MRILDHRGLVFLIWISIPVAIICFGFQLFGVAPVSTPADSVTVTRIDSPSSPALLSELAGDSHSKAERGTFLVQKGVTGNPPVIWADWIQLGKRASSLFAEKSVRFVSRWDTGTKRCSDTLN